MRDYFPYFLPDLLLFFFLNCISVASKTFVNNIEKQVAKLTKRCNFATLCLYCLQIVNGKTCPYFFDG